MRGRFPVSALDVLLAGLPQQRQADQAAQLLARLATMRSPRLVSLWVCAGGGTVLLRVRATGPARSFVEAEQPGYARDLAALDTLADRWGQSTAATGAVSWWARIGDVPRIGGAVTAAGPGVAS